jgi:hypothetical protein
MHPNYDAQPALHIPSLVPVSVFRQVLRSRQGDSGTETEYLPNYPKAGIAVTLIASKQRCLRKLRAVGLLCAAPEVRDLSR